MAQTIASWSWNRKALNRKAFAMRRALHRRKFRTSRQSPSRGPVGSSAPELRRDRPEQPASARRIQRSILHSLPRDDRLRLEYIRRRWQGGQA